MVWSSQEMYMDYVVYDIMKHTWKETKYEEQIMEEIILVDTNDRPVGASNKYEAHVRPLLHRAFSIFIYNGKFMLLQKRHRQNIILAAYGLIVVVHISE